MPAISLATFVVVSDDALTVATVEQAVFTRVFLIGSDRQFRLCAESDELVLSVEDTTKLGRLMLGSAEVWK